MGLNLSLRGQRITPKSLGKPREKSPSIKSIQSIYTLARLASSSNRPRKSSSGATILDFMQCLNFKSKLDREKEMIRRKIQNSTLYKKPSFTYNIYNPMSNGSSAKISKNIRSDFKDDLLKKSIKAIGDDESETNTDEKVNEKADIQCIGNKYVDLTCNISTNTNIAATSKYLEIPESNDSEFKSNKEKYWENATNSILQSNLSPTSSASYQILLKKHVAHESLKKSKTAKHTRTIENSSINCDNINSDNVILNCESLTVNVININHEFSENSECVEQKMSPKIDTEKRKRNSKLFKKRSNSHLLTVGLSLCSKFSDANHSLIETENILTNQKTEKETTTKTKKSSLRKAFKKSSHNKSNSSNTTKSSSKSASATKKAEL
jgi:hypothetical protein